LAVVSLATACHAVILGGPWRVGLVHRVQRPGEAG
jgi:hypothetical protein